MARTLLLHWNQAECMALAADLTATTGIEITPVWAAGDVSLVSLRGAPPRALLISLRRLPSHGREVADAVWSSKWGRQIPIAFFDAPPDKVEALRTRFPSARFVTWDALAAFLTELPPDASLV